MSNINIYPTVEDISTTEVVIINIGKYFIRLFNPKEIFEKSFSFKKRMKNDHIVSFLVERGFRVFHTEIEDDGYRRVFLVSDIHRILVKVTTGSVDIFFDNENSAVYEELCLFFESCRPVIELNKINVLIKTQSGFELVEFENRKTKVNLSDYDCSFNLKEVFNLVNGDKPGLILLSGEPGTGKTFFIRYLCSQIKKRFVFVPNQVVANLSDPGFLGFAVEELKNCILIVEDAETCLVDRKKSMNDSASVLLNVTDGILGDLLNLKIIATINNEEYVDKALMRKGRLLAKVDFNPLPIEKANAVLHRLKKSQRVNKPTILADLYNIEDNGIVNEKTKIGF